MRAVDRTPCGLPGLRRTLSLVIAVGVGLGLLAASSPTPAEPGAQILATELANGSSLGAGIAFIMGGSGVPIPSQRFVDTVDTLYLQPHQFTGDALALFTPEAYYPGNISEAQGASILAQNVQNLVTAEEQEGNSNPVVVFGYSQSAAMSALAMEQLHQDDVPSDLVHFILVGNSANPNGGILERFDIPTGANLYIPSLNQTLGHPTPDLYPTDVYTMEYDGYADFPRYPLNLVSDLNAIAGMLTQHAAYLGLTPEQLATAIPLETTDHTPVNYYMIPADSLPLLDSLRLQPMGNVLADLLEPDLRILVNLGYGSIDDGWSDGPANVETPASLFELLPPNINLSDLLTALINGAQQGFQAAIDDLFDPATYRWTSLLAGPPFSTLLNSVYAMGIIDPPPVVLSDYLSDIWKALAGSAGSVGSVEDAPVFDGL